MSIPPVVRDNRSLLLDSAKTVLTTREVLSAQSHARSQLAKKDTRSPSRVSVNYALLLKSSPMTSRVVRDLDAMCESILQATAPASSVLTTRELSRTNSLAKDLHVVQERFCSKTVIAKSAQPMKRHTKTVFLASFQLVAIGKKSLLKVDVKIAQLSRSQIGVD